MIRTATSSDIETLYKLYETHQLNRARLSDHDYVISMQQNGFIIGSDTPDAFAQEINGSILTLVSEEAGNIAGFVLINKEKKFSDDEHVVWVKPQFQDVYAADAGVAFIHQLIVHPDYKRSKKGSDIISEVSQQLPEKNITHVFAKIMIHPVVNMAYFPFLSKNDFEIVAVSYPHDTNGFEKHMSILMCRKL